MKEYSGSEVVEFEMLKDDWFPSSTELPEVITPRGLSADRQWYLYDEIREFCPGYCQDVVCPLPEVERTRSWQSTP